jgi:hypothetical protein
VAVVAGAFNIEAVVGITITLTTITVEATRIVLTTIDHITTTIKVKIRTS